MHQSAWIIYNPMAGPLDVGHDIDLACRFWQARGWRVRILPTRSPGHAASLARQGVENRCKMVLAAGGDGTVGQIAHGLTGSDTILAVLPFGTANVFAKLLNLVPAAPVARPDTQRICQRLASGMVQTIDVGRAHAPGLPDGGHHFVSWTGIGLDGYVIDRTEPRPKWIKQVTGRRFAWLWYLAVGVPAAIRYRGVQALVKVDNQTVEGTFVLVVIANSRLYGGGLVQLSPDACLDDGRLDVWLFKGEMFGQTLGHALRLLTSRHLMSRSTVHLHGRRVLFQTRGPAAIELDGEPAGQAPLYTVLVPRSLRLLAPEGSPANLFCRPGTPFQAMEGVS